MRILLPLLFLLLPSLLAAQMQVGLGGIRADADTPLEIAADSLAVDNERGTATFTGAVEIGQGGLRLGAPVVEVFYSQDGGIARVLATGGVTIATETDAIEAERADYDLTTEQMVLTGDVLLSQGRNAVSAERMRINTSDGTALLEGRVRTIIRTTGN